MAKLCMVACLAALGLAAVGGEGEAPEETAKLISYLAQEFNFALNVVGATPAKRLEEIVADDAVILWSNGERSNGKAEYLARLAKAREDIRGLFKDLTVSYEVQKVRFLGDAAIILGKVALVGSLAEDEKPYRRTTWQTLVFAKADAGWRLVHEHSNPLAASRSAEPQSKDAPQ